MIDPNRSLLDQGTTIRRMVDERIGDKRTHYSASIALGKIFHELFESGQLTLKELCALAAQGAVYPSPGFQFAPLAPPEGPQSPDRPNPFDAGLVRAKALSQ